jgi:hypothetical protein
VLVLLLGAISPPAQMNASGNYESVMSLSEVAQCQTGQSSGMVETCGQSDYVHLYPGSFCPQQLLWYLPFLYGMVERLKKQLAHLEKLKL